MSAILRLLFFIPYSVIIIYGIFYKNFRIFVQIFTKVYIHSLSELK